MSEAPRELPPPPEDVLHPTDYLMRTLLVTAGLGLAGVAGYQMFWNRKMEQPHHLEAAQKAIGEKNWTAARESLQRVPASMRENATFLETLAEFLKGTRSEPALLAGTLTQLELAGRLKPEDLLWLGRASIAAGNVRSARATLDRLPESLKSSLEGAELKIAVLRAEGRKEEAEENAARLFEQFPDHPDMAVRRAMRDLEGSFPELQKAAFESLLNTAKRDDDEGLRAIRVLSRRVDLTLAQCLLLQQAAAKHTQTAPEDDLAIRSQILHLSPDRREALLQETVQKYRNKDTEDRMRLASWLAREEEHEKVLALAPQEELEQSAELLPSVVQGLARRRQWEEVQKLLREGKKLPVSPARAAVWRALAAWNLNPTDAREARAHLTESILKAELPADALTLMGAAQLAEQCAMLDLALQASQKLAVRGSRQEPEMLEQCWRVAGLLKDSSAMNPVAARLAELRPENLDYALRRDYLRLLRGEGIEMTLTSGHGGQATANQTALLEALKAYRMQDLAQAGKVLAQIASTSGLTVGERAVYAGLLAKTRGQISQAFELAEGIRPELLLAEETVFLKMAL